MAIAGGVSKSLRFKAEATPGTKETTGGQLLRRVTSSLSLVKDTYESNEIRSDYQVVDMRHGARHVEGTIAGELSSLTYQDFFSALLRQPSGTWTTKVSNTGLSLSIALVSGTVYTYSATGVGTGIKAGDIVEVTAGAVNADTTNRKMVVLKSTANALTVATLNGGSITAPQGPVASCTVAQAGKTAMVPTTGHLDRSYTIEHWHSDITQSETFYGCKINSCRISLPATGIATIEWGFLGQNVATGTSANFAAPSAATSTGVMAAVNGVLRSGVSAPGTPENDLLQAVVTGAEINVQAGLAAEATVGTNAMPLYTPGRVRVSGQITAFFTNATLRDAFFNETAHCLSIALGSDAGNNPSSCMAIILPRIKFGGASKDDGEKGLIQTMPFTALYEGTATDFYNTTMCVMDSGAA